MPINAINAPIYGNVENNLRKTLKKKCREPSKKCWNKIFNSWSLMYQPVADL